MNTWIAPLVGQDGWKVTQAQAYRVQRSGGSCPTEHNGLRVYSIEISDMKGANNSFPGFRMRMGDWGINKLVVLHEMGHAIGLGDGYTYSDGSHTPIGQPTSTMKDQWSLKGVLQQDDIDGIRFLWARIRGASEPCPSGYKIGGCNGSGCSGAVYCVPTGTTTGNARLEMSKSTYAVNETIVVRTFNLPGNSTDWVGIYAAGAADTAELQYIYSGGVKNGTMQFTGRAAGSYEARLFFNDSYTREAKVSFKVGSSSVDNCPNDPNKTEPGICGCGVPEGTCSQGPSISMSKSTFAVSETIKVSFSGMSGNSTDWIGLYKTGAANESYLVYQYTGSGKKSGTLSFAGRSAGSYEARLFLNDSYTLKKKVSFTVK
ncbi:MAG: hypothetical protein MUC50_21595 [Myxococcota bacterium]|nr:hypothetical protein [Myxococcota bacterium]